MTNFIQYQREWDGNWSSTGGEGSVAQLGSAGVFFPFHDKFLAAGMTFSIFFFEN